MHKGTYFFDFHTYIYIFSDVATHSLLPRMIQKCFANTKLSRSSIALSKKNINFAPQYII